ncbi:hypothetical protein E2C01_000475 [Portunus trituberculatus]|uniref:Uncharacterized protein n=1 Tax=Portunus trituberculatus TaxID=210409 RepID=A0A5B7CHJ2_PORTR|nr:hypothetical protein [Portunus trituberculatus]
MEASTARLLGFTPRQPPRPAVSSNKSRVWSGWAKWRQPSSTSSCYRPLPPLSHSGDRRNSISKTELSCKAF